MAEELERKAHNFLTDVKSKKKPALQVRGKIAVTVIFLGISKREWGDDLSSCIAHFLNLFCCRALRAMTRTAASASGKRKRRFHSAFPLHLLGSPCLVLLLHLLLDQQRLLPHHLLLLYVSYPLLPLHLRW